MSYQAKNERYKDMIYRRCGRSGLMSSVITLGFWHNFGHDRPLDISYEIVKTAFDNGVTHYDLANNYGVPAGSAEENFGRILRKGFMKYRDEMVITTKAGYDMWEGPYGEWGSRKYLLASLDQSLNRMGLDYVDIFYSHRFDPDTPLEETMLALDQAVRQGKALYVGISNYDSEQTLAASQILKELKTPFVLNQLCYNMFNRYIEGDIMAATVAADIGVIAFSPLAQGLLTDRYLHGVPKDSRAASSSVFLQEHDIDQEKLSIIRALNEIAHNRGQTLSQMALAWILKDERVTSVIVGASKPEQLLENIAVINNMSFDKSEIERIEQTLTK